MTTLTLNSRRKLSCQNRLSVPRNSSRIASTDEFDESIDFVSHPTFRRKHAERVLSRTAPLPDLEARHVASGEPGLTFVAGFVSRPLLSQPEEAALFIWMNFHRFRAERLRQKWLRAKSRRGIASQILCELSQATELRNRIVSSNLRLVVSLAKKLSRSLDHMSELISEGVLPLIRSVELFDVSLGNRFSTYATWAVRNQMLRSIKRAAHLPCTTNSELVLDLAPARREDSSDSAQTAALIGRVNSLIRELPERERLVLCARFGLDGEPSGQSLAEVASRIGLSKERVRQIVIAALARLRTEVAGQESSS